MKIFGKFYWLYLFLFGILCLALLEVVVRIRLEQRFGFPDGAYDNMFKFDERFGIRMPIPNLEVKGAKTHIKINALGFRGSDLAARKSRNTIRIAALGASTTFCAEVSTNDNTWPEQVRVKLARQFPAYHFEMINGGVPGYGIEHSLVNLRKRISNLEPDAILIYHAANEIAYEARRAAIAGGIISSDEKFYGSPLAAFLSRHSRAFDLLYKNAVIYVRQARVNSKSTSKLNEFPKESIFSFATYLDSLRLECEKLSAPMIIFTFSTKYRREQPTEARLENMKSALYYVPWLTPEAFLEAYDLYNRTMFVFSQQHKNVYVDTLHNQIPGTSEYFADSVHFTDHGCQAMAERVCNALLREGVIQNAMARKVAASMELNALK